MPATPTRITSLAPKTRPEAFVPAIVKRGNAAVAVAACLRKLRRLMFFIRSGRFALLSETGPRRQAANYVGQRFQPAPLGYAEINASLKERRSTHGDSPDGHILDVQRPKSDYF